MKKKQTKDNTTDLQLAILLPDLSRASKCASASALGTPTTECCMLYLNNTSSRPSKGVLPLFALLAKTAGETACDVRGHRPLSDRRLTVQPREELQLPSEA